MQVRMKRRFVGKSAEMVLTIPSKEYVRVEEALKAMFALAGHKLRIFNDEGDELFTADEVFPDSHPGKLLRGLRGKEGLSQKAMAERLSISPRHLAEMEKGWREISLDLAKHIGAVFNISYKLFLKEIKPPVRL